MKISQRPGGGERDSTRLQRAAARNKSTHSREARPVLDPHGIYGTRTAYRLRTARRRQVLQNVLVLLLLAASVAGGVWWLRERRVVSLSRVGRMTFNDRAAAFPAWATAAGTTNWIIPCESGSLVTVDAATGGITARFEAGFAFRAQPLIVRDIAYAPAEDGTLYAVAFLKGRSIWSFHSDARISSRPAYVRLPQPGSNVPSTTVASSPADSTAPGNGTPATGSSVPDTDRQMVVVGDDSGLISALNLKNGKVVWTRRINAPAGAALTSVELLGARGGFAGGRILVPHGAGPGTFGGVACLNASDGRVIWRVDLGAVQMPAPVVDVARDSGRVYTVGDNGAVICLDLTTGRKIWKTFVRPLVDGSSEAVVLRGEPLLRSYGNARRLFVGGNDGALRCLDAENGRELWRYETGWPIRAVSRAVRRDELSVERDLLLLAADGPFAYALDATTGELAWKLPASGTAFATPQVLADSVVLITREGWMETFAFG